MCEHIVQQIQREREEQKAAETYRDANRIQLLKTLQRRHEANSELEAKAGVKKIKPIRPNTTIVAPVAGESDLGRTDGGLQTTLNVSRHCSTRMHESKVIQKLKEPRPVSGPVTA